MGNTGLHCHSLIPGLSWEEGIFCQGMWGGLKWKLWGVPIGTRGTLLVLVQSGKAIVLWHHSYSSPCLLAPAQWVNWAGSFRRGAERGRWAIWRYAGAMKCLILEEQGQACKLCHCSVCSVTREGQGREKQLKIVSVCIEESWQLNCPVGVIRYTTDIFTLFCTSVIFTYPAAECVITVMSKTWKQASECKRGKMDWFWLW